MSKTTERRDAPREKRPAAPQAALSGPVRMLITAFLIFNLFAIVAWCVPVDSPLIASCRELVRPYLLYTGLFQKWDMFAPDPSKLNNYISAVVTYGDGKTSEWTFPRMENLGYVEKYSKERYRKYANDCLNLDMYSALWPDAARYIARQNNNASNPPVVVDLVRHWWIVPPPDPNGQPPEARWNQYQFYRYIVRKGDLP